MKKTIILFVIYVLIIFLPSSCEKEKVPVITTSPVSNITTTTGTSGGNITDEGSSTVITRGVCWSTGTTPIIADNKTTDGAGTGIFTSSITGLNAGTVYYVKAYATNSAGTSYGTELIFKTLESGQFADIDGNVYNSLTIGTQTWMAENLKTIKYNNGTAIPLVEDGAAWAALSTPAYCWYNNDAATYKATYGAMYNWYTVNTGKLCPTGWHVPTNAEWTTLATYLGGWDVSGGKLKETGTTHWHSPNDGATNESGFTALPGGYRYNAGTFSDVGYNGYWWSSTEQWAGGYGRHVSYDNSNVVTGNYDKFPGFSVRCVKDN